MAKKIRLADIAENAGVSTATVSRVLNGKSTVAPQTRQAVLTALDLLGYERPEKLRLRPGGLVGLIVPELSNPIFPAIVQELEDELAKNSYTPLLCTQSAGGTTEDQYVSMLIDQHVSGIIFVSGLHADTTADIDRYLSLSETGIPYVFINGWNPNIDAPDFSTDDRSAMKQAVRHLVSAGHTRIGFATGPSRFRTSQEKIGGYTEAMSDLLPDEDPRVITTLFTVEGGQMAATQLIDEGYTGIICGSDIMALGAIRAAQRAGKRVPEDVSIIGFDDSPIMAFTSPPLTSLHQPITKIAALAVSTLIAMIGGSTQPPVSMTFEAELIARESTARSPQ